MKLLVTLLTSNDVNRLSRLIDSFLKQNPTNYFSQVTGVIVVNTTNDSYYQEVLSKKFPLPVVRTESNSRPGKGKNSCLEIFLDSDFDFVSQIDGDDILYPTYLQSLAEHISRFPCIDVLGIIPMDVITDDKNILGHRIEFTDEVVGGVWGISLIHPSSNNPGPGRSYMWDSPLPQSADFIILQSRKSAEIKMNEAMGVGEDHLYSLQLLSEHQKGNLCYFHTMSSDMFIIDRTTTDSVQKIYPQHEHVGELKKLALNYVAEHRSSMWELPIIYKELLLSSAEKEYWLKKFCSNYNHIWNTV
jgi:glycosyltransferase involved in cell wall biosynthesis